MQEATGRRARWGASTIALAALVGSGCGAPAGPIGLVRLPSSKAQEGGRRPLMDVAQAVAGGNVGVLINVPRLREHPSSWGIARIGGWALLLEDGGLEPIFDVERVFISAPAVVSCYPVIAIEHRLGSTRVAAFLDRLLEESHSPRARVEGLGFPAVQVTLHRRTQLVIAPSPGLLVMLPARSAGEAGAFFGARPLPPPVGNEAFVGWSNETGWPALPPVLSALVLRRGRASFSLGVVHYVTLTGESPTPETATADAALLTQVSEEKLRIPGIGARILDPVVFTSSGTSVAGTMRLLPGDLEWILGQMTGPCW